MGHHVERRVYGVAPASGGSRVPGVGRSIGYSGGFWIRISDIPMGAVDRDEMKKYVRQVFADPLPDVDFHGYARASLAQEGDVHLSSLSIQFNPA